MSDWVKPIDGPIHLEGTGVGRHHDDDVAKICLAPVVVRQRAVIHHLQQQVEHVRVRLLDLIEQQHRMWMFGDRLGQQAALVESDVARRRADQSRNRMPLHVLRHVEADELHAHRNRQLARDFGLADARGSGEQEGADRLALIAQAGARHLDGRGQRLDRRVLAEDHQLEVALQVLEHVPVGKRHVLRRNTRDARDDILDVCHRHRRRTLGRRLEAQAGARFVDDVDRLVRADADR